MPIQQSLSTVSVAIANGASLSAAGSVDTLAVVGLVLPSAWTAAGIAFTVSYDGGSTYVPLKVVDKSSAPAGLDTLEILAADVPTATSVLIALDPNDFLGVTHVKVQSQTAGTPVNQGAARTLLLVVRNIGA